MLNDIDWYCVKLRRFKLIDKDQFLNITRELILKMTSVYNKSKLTQSFMGENNLKSVWFQLNLLNSNLQLSWYWKLKRSLTKPFDSIRFNSIQWTAFTFTFYIIKLPVFPLAICIYLNCWGFEVLRVFSSLAWTIHYIQINRT